MWYASPCTNKHSHTLYHTLLPLSCRIMRLKMPIWQESIKADAGCACELFLIFGSALLQFSLLSRIFTFICIKFKCRSTKFAVKKNGRGIAWNYVVRITCPLCCLPFSHYIINTYRYIPTSSPQTISVLQLQWPVWNGCVYMWEKKALEILESRNFGRTPLWDKLFGAAVHSAVER